MSRQGARVASSQPHRGAPERTQEEELLYQEMVIDSLIEEYKAQKENIHLRQSLEQIASDLQEIKAELALVKDERDALKDAKAELTQIREQVAAITEGFRLLNITQLTIGYGGQRTCREDTLADVMRMLDRPPEPPAAAAAQAARSEDSGAPSGEAPAPGRQKPEKTKAQKTMGLVSNIIFYLCMAMMIVGAVTFAQNDDPEKSIFGYRYYYIKTASMEPVYPVGSVVITKSAQTGEIQVGDDITVYVGDGKSDSYLTHRVVEITTDQAGELAFRTKGVNNKANDPSPFNAKLVVGRVVFCIPKLGLVMTFVRDQLWLVVVMFVLLLALAFVLRVLFTPENPEAEKKPEKSKRKRKEKESVK